MTQSYPPTFGLLLRQMRKRAGMTQSDVAAAVGYSVSLISSLEKESRLPDAATVAQLFIPALGLQDEPALAARLVESAAAIRGEAPPASLTAARRNHLAHLSSDHSGLPAPPTSLLGRDAEVSALCNRLLGHGGRLMTLLGPPGIGKSRLALEIASRLQTAWRDGAIFVALAPIDNPALFLDTLARALHLSGDGGLSPLDRLIGFLRRKEMLLVLDNFEQIIPAAPLVAELLAECPGVRVLVTSRERLHLRVEQRVRVAPLPPDAAIRLFVERAKAVRTTFSIDDSEHATVASICQRLDYLPLALELSAARMDLLTPFQLLARLSEKRLDLLRDGPHHLPPHQRTLAAAIQRSYQLLSPQEQKLFRWLGVFAGSFDAEAVAGLGGDPGGLRLLTVHSLLQSEQTGGALRYRMLETLREFAALQLAESGEEDAIRRRHLHWLLDLAHRADGAMRTADRPGWLARLDAEIDNLRSGLTWAVENLPETALALAATLQEFWYSRGYNDEGQRWLGQALAAAPARSTERVRGLNALGQLLAQQSNLTVAQERLEEAAALARALSDGAGLAESLRLSAWVAYDAHDRPSAVALFGESLSAFRALGDDLHAADVLVSQAHMELISVPAGYTHVRAHLEACLAIYRAAADLTGLIFALQQLGQVAVREEAYAEAVGYYDEALELARNLGQRPEIAWGVELLGEAYWLAGNAEAAAICWQEAYQHFLFLGSREAIAITQHHLAQVDRRQGRLAEAGALYAESLAAHEEMGNRHMTARCLAGLGALALAQGEIEEAAHRLDAAQAIFDELPPFLAPADAAEFAALVSRSLALIQSRTSGEPGKMVGFMASEL